MKNSKNVWLNLAGIAVALMAVESPPFFNWVDYRNLIGPQALWLSDTRSDRELLKVHRPHVHFRGEALGGAFAQEGPIPASDLTLYRWDVRTDRNGFRNDRDLASADAIVLGDSFVEGITVPHDQIMTSVLGQLGRTVVANFGQNAYSPAQDLVVLKRYGLNLHPRVVLWMFMDFNDLRQLGFYRNFKRNHDFLDDFANRSYSKRIVLDLRQLLLREEQDLLQRFRAAAAPKQSRFGILRDQTGKPVRMYFLHPANPLTGEDLALLKDTTRIFAEGNRLCREQGARLVVAFVPDQFRAVHQYAELPPDSECRDWKLSDLPQRLREALHTVSPGIGYLDLTPALSAAVARGVIPYYTDDNHWSPAGHAIAARAIHDYLAQAHTSEEISRHQDD